ncbi:Leucine Rich repeat-containing domain protein, partial [Trichostrongylus colubriformis]
MFRPDKVVSFPRTATVASAEERFRSELAGSQVKSFDIRLSDGREADSDIPLLSLGEPLAIVCRLHKSTTETLYKNGTGGRHGRGDVLKYITKFDASGILDLSSAASGDVGLIVDVLKAVGSLSLHSVDLSHNEFTSGFAISHSLLSRCLQLSELRISDLEVGIGVEAFLTAICELPNLQVLDISFNSFIRGSTVESILSSCENLTSLRIDGCDLSGISFVSTWLPNLRELSMVGCCVTDFDSFVEWMSMGCIRRLDLSGTDIALCHVRTLVE